MADFHGTHKDYAVSKGWAKAGKGRMSGEAKAKVDADIASGVVNIIVPEKPTAKPKATKPPAPAPAPKVSTKPTPRVTAPTADIDTKAVRAWARANGYEIGDRGRIHQRIIDAYSKAELGPEPKPKVSAPEVAVRTATRGYSVEISTDPRHRDLLFEHSRCSTCMRGVSFCKCKDGPREPKYLGGKPMLLVKPTV
jgi:hypothetical protein